MKPEEGGSNFNPEDWQEVGSEYSREIRNFAGEIHTILQSVDASRIDITTFNAIYEDLNVDATAMRDYEPGEGESSSDMVWGEYSVHEEGKGEAPQHSLSYALDESGYVRAGLDGMDYENNDVARWLVTESVILLCGLVDARNPDGELVVPHARVNAALRNIHDTLRGRYNQLFDSVQGKTVFEPDDREEIAEMLSGAPQFFAQVLQRAPHTASLVNFSYSHTVPDIGNVIIGTSTENAGPLEWQRTHVAVAQVAEEEFEGAPVTLHKAKFFEILGEQATLMIREIGVDLPDDPDQREQFMAYRSARRPGGLVEEPKPPLVGDFKFFRGVLEKLKESIETDEQG